MSDPCRERISKALEQLLKSVGDQYSKTYDVQAVTIELNREEAIAETQTPILILFEGDEEQLLDFCGEDGYRFPFTLQGAVVGKDGDGTSRANRLRADCIAALKSNLNLYGLARDIEFVSAGSSFGAETASADIRGFIMAFNVLYATKEGDPYTFDWE